MTTFFYITGIVVWSAIALVLLYWLVPALDKWLVYNCRPYDWLRASIHVFTGFRSALKKHKNDPKWMKRYLRDHEKFYHRSKRKAWFWDYSRKKVEKALSKIENTTP